MPTQAESSAQPVCLNSVLSHLGTGEPSRARPQRLVLLTAGLERLGKFGCKKHLLKNRPERLTHSTEKSNESKDSLKLPSGTEEA